MRRISRTGFALAAGLAVLVPSAAAADRPWYKGADSDQAGGSFSRVLENRSAFSFQGEDPPSDPRGLPEAQENMQVVGKTTLDHPQWGPVQLGQIADVAVHKGYAYLNSWDDPECRRGGAFVVDIRNPAAPKQVGFLPAKFPFYHGEGAHAISVDLPGFKGDVLAVNNESYGSNVALTEPLTAECDQDYDGDPETENNTAGGGFDLWNVTDPTNPQPLVRGAGDRDANTPDDPSDDTLLANSYHSVFVWQAGPRAYLVASDNTELTDVDIFDITDPANPEQIGDLDLLEQFPDIADGESSNGGLVLHHDVVVKQINGRFIMKADYWDAGYVQLDVTDPANPTYVTDTTFDAEDPLFPGSGLTPEGNAHQGEFSADNQFLLAADEDFSVSRPTASAPTGPNPDRLATPGTSDGVQIGSLPDGQINGPTTFVGDGCTGAPIPAVTPDPDPEVDTVALIERGGPDADACTFATKFDTAQAAGYEAVIVFNQADRPDGDPVGGMSTEGAEIPGALISREAALGEDGILIAGTGDGQATPTPARGTAGPDVIVTERFDGWGYAHLYDAKTSERIDSYAIPEAIDPRYAQGFGDLSIHEFATDPGTNLAYAAYYGGGLRTFRFSREAGLEPVGKLILPGGSNMWGVEQFTAPNGERLIAGSDRDYGLVIARYTGPGAVGPTPVTPPPGPGTGQPGTPPATPPAANRNALTVRSVAYRKGRIVLAGRVGKRGRIAAQVTAKVRRTAGARKARTTRLGARSLRLRKAEGGAYRFAVRLSTKQRRMLERTRKGGAVRLTIRVDWDPTPGPATFKTIRVRVRGT